MFANPNNAPKKPNYKIAEIVQKPDGRRPPRSDSITKVLLSDYEEIPGSAARRNLHIYCGVVHASQKRQRCLTRVSGCHVSLI